MLSRETIELLCRVGAGTPMDRTHEHLGTADPMVIRVGRRMLEGGFGRTRRYGQEP